MIITIIIGIVSSIFAEVVTWVNCKLQGTVLTGDGAFIVSIIVAVIASIVKVFYIDATPLPSLASFSTWQTIAPVFAQVWTVSQVMFMLIIARFNLDVKSGT